MKMEDRKGLFMVFIALVSLVAIIVYQNVKTKSEPIQMKTTLVDDNSKKEDNSKSQDFIEKEDEVDRKEISNEPDQESTTVSPFRASLQMSKQQPLESLSRPSSTPTSIGNEVDPDFGNSKYDKNINWEELVNGKRSLEEIRAERRNEEIKSILLNVFIGGVILIIVVVLLKRTKRGN